MARQTRREFLYRSLGSLSALALVPAAVSTRGRDDAGGEIACLADLAAAGRTRPTLEACTRDDAGGTSC
jgi:hypothetical protein